MLHFTPLFLNRNSSYLLQPFMKLRFKMQMKSTLLYRPEKNRLTLLLLPMHFIILIPFLLTQFIIILWQFNYHFMHFKTLFHLYSNINPCGTVFFDRIIGIVSFMHCTKLNNQEVNNEFCIKFKMPQIMGFRMPRFSAILICWEMFPTVLHTMRFITFWYHPNLFRWIILRYRMPN